MSLDLGWFLWVLSCLLSRRTNDSCKCSLEGCGFQLQPVCVGRWLRCFAF